MLHEMQPSNYSLGLSLALQQIFLQGIRFSAPLDMKVVELTGKPFNSQ
jgi:hypothetical protein